MKKTYILFALVLCATSCSDFLEVTPETRYTPSNFFQTERHVDNAVAGIYEQNRFLHNSLQWTFGELMSDNSSIFYHPTDRGGIQTEEIDQFLMETGNGTLSNYWNTVYTGISRCNYVLERIDGITFENQANREKRRGEALFFRSWFYFNLVRLFGDVPYINTLFNTTGEALSDTYTQRRPAAEVYQFILADAQLAIDKLPTTWPGEAGRATKGAALMLKAKIHMAQGKDQHSLAIPLLEQVSGLGYSLLPNYKDVFDPLFKNHAESIFEIQYSYELNQSSNFLSSFVPWNSDTLILGTSGPAGPRAGLNQPTNDLIKLYRAGDRRKEATITNFIALNNITIDSDNDTIPYLSKYAFPFLDRGQQNVNWPMFRYADAMLMLAECYNTVNPLDQNAIGLVNLVRLRAGVPPLSDVSPDPTLVVSTAQELELAIERERRVELAFENHRWFDLVRTGKVVEVMTAHGIAKKAENAKDVADAAAAVPARAIYALSQDAYTNIRTPLAIPFSQVQNFGTEQTPGW
jgi:starch-binding outer membrane protein, SusD/RagB family